MKYRTSQKAIRAGYDKVFSVGYCNLQHLFECRGPVAYTTRREGWGSDIYDIGDGIAISTGYAPFGRKTDYALCKKYDDLAAVVCADTWNWDDRRPRLDALIEQFREELTAKKGTRK